MPHAVIGRSRCVTEEAFSCLSETKETIPYSGPLWPVGLQFAPPDTCAHLHFGKIIFGIEHDGSMIMDEPPSALTVAGHNHVCAMYFL